MEGSGGAPQEGTEAPGRGVGQKLQSIKSEN